MNRIIFFVAVIMLNTVMVAEESAAQTSGVEKDVQAVPQTGEGNKDVPMGNAEPASGNEVFSWVSEAPVFQGNFEEFTKQNLVYPFEAKKNDIQGKVFVRFIIEKDGQISDVKIIKGIDPLLDSAALKFARLTNGKWTTGKNNGVPVRVFKNLPVVFKMEPSVKPSGDSTHKDEPVMTFVGEMPVLKEDLNEFIRKNLRYPPDAVKNKIEGKVYAKIVVEADGHVSDIKIIRGVYPSLDEEVIRVIKLTDGKWKPGKNNGNPVRTYKSLPVIFSLK